VGVGVELGEWTSDGMGDHLDLGSYLLESSPRTLYGVIYRHSLRFYDQFDPKQIVNGLKTVRIHPE
jgi:hypothetical protein